MNKEHTNLYFIDRIDCEDEQKKDTPLEQLVPKLLEMKERGYSMPTLLIRCAGKKADGVVKSPSSMKAIDILRQEGSEIGIHVHTKSHDNGEKNIDDYYKPEKMRQQLEEACQRFCDAFGFLPGLFGCGDCAISCEGVASILKEFNIRLSLGDILSPRRYPVPKGSHPRNKAEYWFDYSTSNWRTDYPLYKHGVWWVPAGTDDPETVPAEMGDHTYLSLYKGTSDDFRRIFSRYHKIGELFPDKTIIISSVVHPPETLKRWQHWLDMHMVATEFGFQNISSKEAFDILKT